MVNRPPHRSQTCLALAAALVLFGMASSAAAQGQRSAALTVSVTVVRSCTVEQVAAPPLPGTAGPATGAQPTPSPGPAYRLRCGQQTVGYPSQPGTQVTPLTKGAPVTVTGAADGRGVVIQF